MKGIVFTEFLKMVEEVFSLEMADKIIQASHLPSKGIYTNIGTYDHKEMIELVTHLSKETGIPISDLEVTYGKYLFKSFTKYYKNFISGHNSLFDFLMSVNNTIHVEVRKLYPDAELPHLHYQRVSDNQLIIDYQSTRPFADLAEGLIRGSAEHFNVKINLNRKNITENGEGKVRFIIETT